MMYIFRFFLSITIIIIYNSLFINKLAFSESPSITVAAAANVKFVMNDLKQEFKNQTGIEIKPIISSSGKLSSQIQNGAPFDIFMSADISYPNKLYLSGFTSSKPKVYAYGTLVLWTTKNLELKDNIKILNNDNVNKISIANPKNAPYGEESINTLKYYKMYDQIKHKIIYGESISQINNYVILNAVDIGFTSKSSVLSPEMINKGKWIEIDKKSYKPIAQGVVILKHGIKNNADNSKKFYNFLFSKRAKKIFEKYGYIVKNNE